MNNYIHPNKVLPAPSVAIVVIRWLPGEWSALSSPWMFGNAPYCDAGLQLRLQRLIPVPPEGFTYLPMQLCLDVISLLQGGRHQNALRLCCNCGTGTSEELACAAGAHLPVSRPNTLSISVIFDQSCRRSQGRWWTDASPSLQSRCLCSVRSSAKKLTGCYWFPLFRDSLYTRRPKWGHSPAFWHILRVCILKLHPAQRISYKKMRSIQCLC